MSLLTVNAIGVSEYEAPIQATSLLIVRAFGVEGGGGGPSGASVVASVNVEVTASPFNITIPTETQEGDLLLVLTGGRAGAVYTPPVAYTTMYAYSEGGNTSSQALYRWAAAGEGDSVEAWTSNFTDREREVTMLVIRGLAGSGDPLDTAVVKASAYNDTPTTPEITTVTAGALVIYQYAQRIASDAYTEDTGYPASHTGVLRRYVGTSAQGIAYSVVASPGVVAADAWSTNAAEANLHIDTAIALRPA